MWLNWFLVVSLNVYCLVDSSQFFPGEIDPEAEWDSMESFFQSDDEYDGEDFLPEFKGGKPRRPLKLPESIPILASELHKEYFNPEKGARPVPQLVQSILLPVIPPAKTATSGTSGPKPVEVLCHLDRIYVRVLKSVFSNPNASINLKLGTCAVNKRTKSHYYFMYFLNACGLKRGEDKNRVIYTSSLYYRPVLTGPIVRELPFTVPIRCTYTKFRRSYSRGFLPKIASETLFRGLQTGFTLSPVDASWNFLPVGQSFILGKPVCFEAKGPSTAVNQRLYLNRCFVTQSPNFQSTDRYFIIDNQGCLVDSANSTLAKFYATASNMTVRLCFAAFLFKNMVSQPHSPKSMFMHCELNVGSQTPTPSAKSCTYNSQTKMWTELLGDSSVCDCCASTCPAPLVATGKSLITSKSWNLGREPLLPFPPDESIPELSSSGLDDLDSFWDLIDK